MDTIKEESKFNKSQSMDSFGSKALREFSENFEVKLLNLMPKDQKVLFDKSEKSL